ncbi:MAG TPA: isocitrate/isopropylmalate family dehydrogenase [Thermoanaerobaculia bacterium]
MARYLGETAIADRIDRALRATLAAGIRTRDLGGEASTTEFTEAVVREMERG